MGLGFLCVQQQQQPQSFSRVLGAGSAVGRELPGRSVRKHQGAPRPCAAQGLSFLEECLPGCTYSTFLLFLLLAFFFFYNDKGFFPPLTGKVDLMPYPEHFIIILQSVLCVGPVCVLQITHSSLPALRK